MFHFRVVALLGMQAICVFGTSVDSGNKSHHLYRVLGGKEAVPHSYPSLIHCVPAESYDFFGAALLHPRWILTDGSAPKYLHGFLFFAGVHNINNINNETEENQISWGVKHVHPGYDEHVTGSKNDIALFSLDTPFELNERVQPVAVATDSFPLPERTSIVGWGFFNLSDRHSSDVLREADAPIMPDELCGELWKAEGYPKRVWNNFTLCAGEINGSNACYVDLGSPLYAKVEEEDGKRRQVLLGVLSEPGCLPQEHDWKNIVSIYVRVSKYIDWIENVTGLQFEPQGSTGYGFFKDSSGETGNAEARPRPSKEAEAVIKLASRLAGNICSQMDSYFNTKNLQPPVKKRPAVSSNAKCGSFLKKNCGSMSCQPFHFFKC